MADFIRVKSKGTLKELLQALIHSRSQVVYIEIPTGSSLWQTKPLRLVRRAGLETGKRVVLVTNTRIGSIRARDAGLTSVSEEELRNGQIKKTTAPVALNSPASWVTQNTGPLRDNKIFLSNRKRRWIFAASSLAALVAGFVVSNIFLQKAVITVYARTQSNPGHIDLIIDGTAAGPNVAEKLVPAILVDKELTIAENFNATGTRNSGAPARGLAVLYSSYPATLTLKASTTYLASESGLRYRFSQDVRGLKPGVPLNIEIVAEAGGAAGNLKAGSSLAVHNAAFGFRPQVLYAGVGDSDLAGGGDETATIVSEQDIIYAREKIVQKASDQANQELGESIVFPASLAKTTISQESFSAQAGDATADFNGQMTLRLQGLAFDQNLVLDVLNQQGVTAMLAHQQFLETKEDAIKYEIRSVDFEKGLAVLNVSFESLWMEKINPDDLKILLSGRTIPEVKNLLLQKSQIAAVKIDLAPFWLKRTPKSSKKIDTRVEVER